MARPEIEPTISPWDGPGHADEIKLEHPAFAQISAHRVSGHTHLYASDFDHQNYMVVTISPSSMHRNLSNSWYFTGRRDYIEVAMSEQQWATFISSANVGSGTPCTLSYKDGEQIPGIKPIPTPALFEREMTKAFDDQLAALDALQKEFDDEKHKMSAAMRERMQDLLRRNRSILTSTVPWIEKQFNEHMEATVEAAKSEVHAYHQAQVTALGLEKLAEIQQGSSQAQPKKAGMITIRKASNGKDQQS